MKYSKKIVFIGGASLIILMTTLVVQAIGQDNLKLKMFALTQHFHDQNKELGDLRSQNVDPDKNTRIDLTQLLNGGPPKDGIPSIDKPVFDNAQTTSFKSDEQVIGVVINGEAKAYPLGILNWHEIVNDRLGDRNITVSYCPLCDTGIAFERGNSTYGVSGKLYQSCLVMYDRADDTIYAQPWAIGVVGSQVNRPLKRLPIVKTNLGNWLKKYPNSQVLSTETGHSRDYFRYPYGEYLTSKDLVFPVRNQDKLAHHPKAIVSYVWEPDQKTPNNLFSGVSHQFIHEEVKRVSNQTINFNGRQIRARWEQQLETVIIEESDGSTVPSTTAFAFVYPAFFR